MSAKENIAIANGFCGSILRMPKTQLPEFMKARIGGSGKMTADEVAKRGDLTNSYISDLMRGKANPASLSVDAIRRLAKGMREHPAVVFRAAIGQLKPGLSEESVEQVLMDFCELDQKGRNELEFILVQFKKMISERQPVNPK